MAPTWKIFSVLSSSPKTSQSQDKQLEDNSYFIVFFQNVGPSTTEMLRVLLWSLALCEPENRSTLHQKERIYRISCSQTATHTNDFFVVSWTQTEETLANKSHAYFYSDYQKWHIPEIPKRLIFQLWLDEVLSRTGVQSFSSHLCLIHF